MASNLGKVTRYQPKRRRTDLPPEDHDIDFLGVWVAIIALAVVVAVFGKTLLGPW